MPIFLTCQPSIAEQAASHTPQTILVPFLPTSGLVFNNLVHGRPPPSALPLYLLLVVAATIIDLLSPLILLSPSSSRPLTMTSDNRRALAEAHILAALAGKALWLLVCPALGTMTQAFGVQSHNMGQASIFTTRARM